MTHEMPSQDTSAFRRSDRKDKKRFRTDATEKFVIVKPPPGAIVTHPLQVQFIPPAQTLESRSFASLTSPSASTTSVNSTLSSLRRIIPLYNLQNHTLQASTIHDAGTDDKVSRFAKHGIDLIDVGLFEPVEVWGSCPIDFEDEPPCKAGATTSGLLDIPNVTANVQRNGHIEDSGNKDSGMRKFFGKLFQSKSQSSLNPKAKDNHNPVIAPPPRSPRGSIPGSPSPSPPLSNSNARPEHALPPVLGTVPQLQSLMVPPQGRPTAYVFVARKWNKSGGENWLQHKLLHYEDTRFEVDLRFEWTRSTERRSGFRKALTVPSGYSPSPSPLSRPMSLGQLSSPANESVSLSSSPARHIPTSDSTASSHGSKFEPPEHHSPHSASLHRRRSSHGAVHPSDEVDTEDESDPEDSEVPWTCTLVVRPRNPPSSASSPSSGDPVPGFLSPSRSPPLRLKVASLAPAPHHPKVVAQLKCPYPLPDVDLRNAALVQREELPGVPDSAPRERHMLCAEEIKDIVCSTSIWLVVREGFGGLGKKSGSKARRRS